MHASNILEKTKGAAIISAAGISTALLSAKAASAQNGFVAPTNAKDAIADGAKATAGGAGSGNDNLESIFLTVVNTLLFIVGAISVMMLVIGGLRYVVSAGDQNAVQGAKNTILYAIVGLVIAFLSFAAVNFVVREVSEEPTTL